MGLKSQEVAGARDRGERIRGSGGLGPAHPTQKAAGQLRTHAPPTLLARDPEAEGARLFPSPVRRSCVVAAERERERAATVLVACGEGSGL